MSCLAVLFALSEQEVLELKSVPRKERADYMHNEIEEVFFDEFPEDMLELDRSWDLMHRILTDGNLDFENKFPPLCNVIFGGEQLYGITLENGEHVVPEDEDDEFIILKTPKQVQEIAEALPKRTREECLQCYELVDEEDYGFPLDEEEFEYTWEMIQESIPFWEKAAAEQKYVLFTVDR